MRFLLLLVFTFGCSIAGAEGWVTRLESGLERIYGLDFAEDGLTFQVASSGCTDKEDFVVKTLRDDPSSLLLIRIAPDLCDAYVPYGTKIRFGFDELGFGTGDRFFVRNRLHELSVR